MSEIDAKLQAMGLVLPAPPKLPPGVVLPFSWVRVRGNRALVSGHIPVQPDGAIAKPLGKVGAELTARSVVHTSTLPFGAPVEIEAEVEIQT